ncbi:MAG: 6-hydroxymethyl-7,8-dihydropterin pyrophosphokinase [Candidatus Thorarchaeota archaeon]|nr:MAG: 6-hydroxymethyl-7,8-dihydropterin pyrophosphokinase [Candidatus Thorarchaeota archaeon]
MDWSDWQPVYLAIAKRLSLDIDADRKATALLTSLLEDIDPAPLLNKLENKIRNRIVVVCGAGPSLGQQLDEVMSMPETVDAIYVAADGAASAFLELGRKCDILVTDLDGNNDDLKTMMNHGALPIIHAHGDNMHRVEEFVPTLNTALGSTQVEPTDRAFLWGGFTDGDRACHITLHYAPRRLILVGMDFGNVVGRWSKPNRPLHYEADDRKRVKLEIAEELVLGLLARTSVPCSFMI